MKLENIESVFRNNRSVAVSSEQEEKLNLSYQFLKEFCNGRVVYGVNTGFGPMAQYRIDDDSLVALQYNLIRSHCCGAGQHLSKENVRSAMLVRMQTFLAGKSGVHADTVKLLADFLNNDIVPVVPEHGSVGASGDLVQLSHIALALLGEGEVYFKDKLMPAEEAMKACGLEPLKMTIREGLALANGTAVMTGIGFVNLTYAKRLYHYSILASVMMNEIASSYNDFLSPVLNDAKNHTGQSEVARQMRDIASSSQLLRNRYDEKVDPNQNSEETVFTHKVQPYYSLRCTPQILGPVYDTIAQTEKILMEEFYAVDDNPVVDPETKSVYHGGNFHGDYISFEMDKLKIAITKLTMLAERQINYLFHDRINGILPPFVNLGVLGLNYGLQAAQFTATSTTAESQMLSNPMYVHSIPNNNDNQDVVSMGTNSALIAQKVIENSFQVLAIQMMALVQAVDCLKISEQLSDQTKALYDEVRSLVPVFVEDSTKHKEIAILVEFLKK